MNPDPQHLPIPVMVGHVTPPADMMAAARRDLSSEGFATLMAQIGGRSPTPAELVALVEQERTLGTSPQPADA